MVSRSLIHDRVSRRAALRGTSFGLAGLVAAGLIGCGGDDDDGEAGEGSGAAGTATAGGSSTGTAEAAGEPRTGGTLLLTASSNTTHLDVSKDASTHTLLTGSTMYSQLLRYDPQKLPDEREVIGDLAEGWEVLDEGQSVSFKLRSGVTFHDGKPLTSADVASTFERAREVNPLRDLLVDIVSVETPDETTAVFKLTRPVSYLIDLLAAPTSAIMPKHIIEVDDTSLETTPVGTGPFQLDSWERNISITVKKNPNYFLEGLPYLDAATFIQVADNAAEVNGIRTGQIQVSHQNARITMEDLAQLQADIPDLQVHQPICGCTDAIYMNNTIAPFNDVRVRRAFGMLIDSPRVAELLRGGAARPGSYMFDSRLGEDELKERIPGYDGITDDDIAEAKKLLEAAGFANGTVQYRDSTTASPNYLTFYRDAFSKAGIEVTSVPQLQYPAEIFEALKNLDYQISSCPAIFAMIHPTTFFGINATGNAENKTGYSNPTYDGLFEELLAAVDPQEVDDLSIEMERILLDDVPWVNACTPVFNMAIRPEVGNYHGPKFLRDYFDLGQVYLKA